MAAAAQAFGNIQLADALMRLSTSFASNFEPNTFVPTEQEYETVRQRRGKPS
jgi:hypothetical protein